MGENDTKISPDSLVHGESAQESGEGYKFYALADYAIRNFIAGCVPVSCDCGRICGRRYGPCPRNGNYGQTYFMPVAELGGCKVGANRQ